MSVGENIRRYRKSRGMTQAQLAEAVGLTEGAVRHYESGIRAVKPGRETNVIGRVIESYAKRFGYGVVRDYTGHGVHTAFQDSTPMVLLVGDVASDQRDREAFQEVDYFSFFGPSTKGTGCSP